MSVELLTEHRLECESLKGGCTGSSVSTLVKMPHCVAAQFMMRTIRWVHSYLKEQEKLRQVPQIYFFMYAVRRFVLEFIIPTLFKKSVGDIAIASVHLSVRPSRYLPLNHWTKSNQIWCVGCSHEWGMQRHIFFGPAPWGPGEGPNQISLKLNYKVNLKDFLTKLCVSSHT